MIVTVDSAGGIAGTGGSALRMEIPDTEVGLTHQIVGLVKRSQLNGVPVDQGADGFLKTVTVDVGESDSRLSVTQSDANPTHDFAELLDLLEGDRCSIFVDR